MASLKPIQSVLAFLTILPVGKQNQDIYYIAKNMYLFPVAGLVIGSIIGAMALGISNFLHPLLTGFLITGALVILTGVHHTDALADFADGLMAKGSKEIKHKAMLDPAVGSAGVVTLVMYFAGMIIVFNIGFGSNLAVFTSIITAEVVAKYVMVLLANRGISAWEGFSSPFIAGDEGQAQDDCGYWHNDCNCMVCHQLCRLYCTDHFDSPCTVLEVYF